MDSRLIASDCARRDEFIRFGNCADLNR